MMLNKTLRRRLSVILALLMTFLLLAPALAEDIKGKANTGGIVVYDQPNTSSLALANLVKDREYVVIGKTGSWYRIELSSSSAGYVESKYIDVTGTVPNLPTVIDPNDPATPTPTPTPTPAASSASGKTTTSVKLRKGPGTTYDSIKTLSKNTSVVVLGKTSDWYKVTAGSDTGYVAASYLTVTGTVPNLDSSAATPTPTPTPTPAPGASAGTTAASGKTTGNVRLRKGPSTSYDSLVTISSGTTVEVLGKTGDWYQVKYKTYTGYVSGAYLSVTGTVPVLDTASASPSTTPSSTPASTSGEASGKTTARVYLRQGPSTSTSSLGLLSKDTLVKVVGKTGLWYKVSYGTLTGYIRSDYLSVSGTVADLDASSTPTPTPSPSSSPAGASATPSASPAESANGVTTSRVNLRKSNSTSSATLSIISKNTTVKVLGKSGAWYYVEVGGTKGFMHSDYVSVTGSVPNYDPTTASPSPSVSPDSSYFPLTATQTLKQGSSGDSVKGLQQRLTTLGYFKATVDGQYGDTTVEAVKAFQKANSLTADGIAGKQTITKLLDATDKATEGNYVTLRRGSEGDAVTKLQTKLKELKYFAGDCTGYYGLQTENAVKAFQKANNLDQDGVAGAKTQTLLYGGQAPAATATPDSTTLPNITLDTTKTLKEGDTGDNVIALQKALIARGYLTGSADGSFGTKTKSAVKRFQAAAGLETDGVAGPSTLEALMTSKVVASDELSQVSTNGIKLVDWWTGEIDSIWDRGETAKVTDVLTGITFMVQRLGGSNHVDWEPLTAEDTEKMMQTRNGKTSWTARAIYVEINGQSYVAAINCMPHGTYHISGNDYAGHSCMHFLNSTTHSSGKINSDMQERIQYAWKVATGSSN